MSNMISLMMRGEVPPKVKLKVGNFRKEVFVLMYRCLGESYR